jgi:hypothetical protein
VTNPSTKKTATDTSTITDALSASPLMPLRRFWA